MSDVEEADKRFNLFKNDFSNFFVGEDYRYLRFCLSDHINIDYLANKDIVGTNLLEVLDEKGHISCSDVSILTEIAELTGLVKAQRVVHNYKISNNVPESKGQQMRILRKAMYKTLKSVAPDEVKVVAPFYRATKFGIKDIWNLLFHLEVKKELNTPAKIDTFAKLLNPVARDILLQGLRDDADANKVEGASPGILDKIEFVSRLEHIPLENTQQLYTDINTAFIALRQSQSEDVQPIQVDRSQMLDQLLLLYKNDQQLPIKRIKVEFVGEPAQDYGGLSKEIFTSFWSKAAEGNLFGGKHVKVPFLERHRRRRETWKYKSVGAILSHTVVVTGSLPSEIAMSVIIQLFGREVDEVCLLHDFMLYVTSTEEKILSKAIDKFDDLTEDETKDLESIFVAYRYNAEPRREDIKEQIMDIAEDWLITEPSKLIAEMRKGIPESHVEHFWRKLSVNHLRYIALVQRPTPETVVDVIKSTKEDHTNAEENCFYFLKEFVRGITDQKVLNAFLTMVTGSIHQPNEILVSFIPLVGIARRPILHTCNNLIELPTSYETQQVFKQEMILVLNHPDATTYSAI